MSRSLTALMGLCLSLSALRADEEAQKTLERAIAAQGGASALERMPRMVRTTSGSVFANTQESACTTELHCDMPARFRLEVELTAQKQKLLAIYAGSKGWTVSGGLSQEMPAGLIQEMQSEAYAQHILSLVPIRDGKNITLKTIPGLKVQGAETAGILVSKKGQDDVRLFFDKSSGLLVQMQRRDQAAGLVRAKDYVFGDYKDFNGLKMPTHYTEKVNGQKVMEFKTIKYTFPSKPDERMFGKP